jgi:hypothetical protein
MKKDPRKVMLGCWGIGGALSPRFERRLPIEKGPFKGYSIPCSAETEISRLALKKRLPPLSRKSEDGIDFMPFILYDKVTIDKVAFDCLLNPPERGLLEYWEPSLRSKRIIEKLASDDIIIVEDYVSHLESQGIRSLIDEVNVLDLSDPSITKPTKESLELWMQFYKDLLIRDDSTLGNFHSMKKSLKRGDKNEVFGYAYECISDINRMLILSHKMNQPIYEWEDYRRFYSFKFKRVAQNSPSKTKGDTLRQLFEVFIPNYEVTSYSQLQEIRKDNRLENVRSLINRSDEIKIDKDFVIQAYEDVMKVKNKIESYSKYIGWSGYALSILPGIVGTGIQELTKMFVKKKFESGIKWQMFLSTEHLPIRIRVLRTVSKKLKKDK